MPDRPDTDGATCEATPGLMPLERAVVLAREAVRPTHESESVALAAAFGRISAEKVTASLAMPFFDNSAMDGFALRLADLDDSKTLAVAGTIPAGATPTALPPGCAMKIYTGAPVPEAADAVAMAENCTEAEGVVRVDHVPEPGANIRRSGSDQPAGAALLAPGQRVGARHIGLIAANGVSQLSVARRPRVAVFSTGDELARGARGPGGIHDANRPMLLALARAAGAEVTDLGILPDDLTETTRAFSGLGDRFDLVLTSGAVSVGGRDHVRDALTAAGGQLDGWRVAVKPGKPVAFGRIGQTAITGLPGNPFAAFVGFHLFAAPQIARLMGAKARPFADTPARAAFGWRRKPGRAEIFPVRRAGYDTDGLARLERLGQSVSATLFPLSEADGLAIVASATTEVRVDDTLAWHPFATDGDVA